MIPTFDHLRRKIVQSPAKRLASVSRRVHAPPKVSNLELAVDPKQQVLGLDVAVDDVLPVQVNQRVRHLVDVPRAALLGEASVLGELSVELSPARKLEHEEDALLVMEVAIEAEDVRVSQVLLDLNLAPDLLLDARLDDLGLVQALEGKDVIWFGLGTDHVHATELALAERATDVEVGQMPFACWPFTA